MKTNILLAAVAALSFGSAAQAAFPIYAPIGTPSTTPNVFVSTGHGPVTAYFAGFSAGLDSRIGVSINDGPVALFGLLNKTSALGQSLVLGNVTVGDKLEFVLKVGGSGPFYSTTAADNPGGLNHAWSTPYAGGDFGVPSGTFIAFEDLPKLGDIDYNDHRFVFTYPGAAGVPEPATWALLIAGFGLVGASLRLRNKDVGASLRLRNKNVGASLRLRNKDVGASLRLRNSKAGFAARRRTSVARVTA